MRTLPLSSKKAELYEFTVLLITGKSLKIKAESHNYLIDEDCSMVLQHEFIYANKVVAFLPANMVICVYRNDLNGDVDETLANEAYYETKKTTGRKRKPATTADE